MKLDRIDRRLLATLLENGRIANTALAAAVGLSPSPCWQRVRRLEDAGVVTGYSATLDLERLGHGETVFVEVTLDRHRPDTLEEFARRMQELPQVLEIYLMAGDCDFLLKVATDGTKGTEAFLRDYLFRVPGIRTSKTSFALNCLKRRQAFVPDDGGER